MSRIYGNWGRLVTATLRREEFRSSALRTPSDLSSASASVSESPSSISFRSSDDDVDEVPSSSFSYRPLTYTEICKATNNFNPSNLINHAKSGRSFYGSLKDGTRVVVEIGAIEMHRELSHSRLVPLLGDAQHLLVYKYMSKADLSRNLHEIGWETRLKIAIGAAEALTYLHHEFVPPLVHRNVQASSLLLDDDFEVRLGSLSYLCRQTKPNPISSFRPPLLPEGFKQEAPGDMIAFDVFCFGRVLLELLADKQIWRAAAAAHHETATDTTALASIDQNIPELVLGIADPSLIIHEHLLTEVWGVFLVAKACLMPRPRSSNRLQMTDILLALKLIASARPETSGIIEPFSHVIHRALVTNLLMDTLIHGIEEDYRYWLKLVIQCFSELRDATINFTVEAVAETANEKVCKARFKRTSKSISSNETLISVRQYHSQDMEELHVAVSGKHARKTPSPKPPQVTWILFKGQRAIPCH